MCHLEVKVINAPDFHVVVPEATTENISVLDPAVGGWDLPNSCTMFNP